jgi:exopolyphosphatase/guanosine-5'-triphosphate,3'-diphosphate pyrophosphatase
VAERTESYRVGSVAWSMKYFPEGQFTPAAFEPRRSRRRPCSTTRWQLHADQLGRGLRLLRHHRRGRRRAGRGRPSGGWSPAKACDWLQDRLLQGRSADRVRCPALKEDRKAVIGGGVSVLRAVFDLLGIDRDAGRPKARCATACCTNCWIASDSRHRRAHRHGAAAGHRFAVDAAQASASAKPWPVRAAAPAALRRQHGEPLRPRTAQAGLGGAAARDRQRRFRTATITSTAPTSSTTPTLPASRQRAACLGQLVLGHRGKLRKLEARSDDDLRACSCCACGWP